MAKKKKAKKAAKVVKKDREVLVVASKVKAYIKEHDMNTSAEAITAISEKVYSMLDQAVARSQCNGRKTLKSHDV